MKNLEKVISIFLCLVIASGFFMFNVDGVTVSSNYKWRVTVYQENGSSLYESAYIRLNYILTDGSGTLGYITISDGIGTGTPWNNVKGKYYTYISDSSISVNGDLLPSSQSLPANAMPISVEAFCALSGSFFTTPKAKWQVSLEVFNSSNGLMGDNSYGSMIEISSVAGEYVSGTATDQLDSKYYIDFVATEKIIPYGYDFKADRWGFYNINETIDLQYYTGLYGDAKGTELYNFRGEKEAHGHCFGMATSTAATLINAPYVTDYISWTGLPYTKLCSVNEGTMNIDMDISAKDYIKYCHIYQDSLYVAKQRNNPSQEGIVNVYNAVKNAAQVSQSSTMIAIDLFGGSGGHTVYAIGVDGADILVNDSNVKGTIQRIKVNGNNWTYSAAGLYWDNSVATINYVENCIEPYMRLVWNIDVEGGKVPDNSNASVSYTEESELNGTNNSYSVYIEPIDTDKLLVVSEEDSFSFSEADSMFKLYYTYGNATDSDNGIYWLDGTATINAENTGDDKATVKLVGNNSKISADMPVDSVAQMTIEQSGENKVLCEVEENENVVVTFTSYEENDTEKTFVISGTANGENLVVEEKDDEINVSGLNDIDIIFDTEDHKVEKSLDVTDGSEVNIGIEYDSDNGYSIVTDFEKEDEEITEDDAKEEIKECSHMCHSSNGFLQFVWKIVNFFSKLFGINPICECGKRHY